MKQYTLHLQAHEGMERFKNGIHSSNKVEALLEHARRWRLMPDSEIRYRFKWKIVRNADNVTIAQSKGYLR